MWTNQPVQGKKPMIRKLWNSVLAATVALPLVSGAQVPILPGLPPGMQQPQADESTQRLVWQAILGRYPEMVDGPERAGTFVVALVLWPDGRYVAGGMRYAELPNQTGAIQQELRDQLPMDINGVQGLGSPRRGSVVPGNRILKANVQMTVSMVPSNWDASRDKGIVRRAVMQSHSDLFLSRNGDHVNQLVVVMNEKGEIAQKRVVQVRVEHQGNMTMYNNSGPKAADFSALGLDADRVGVMGDFSINLPMTTRPAMPMPTVGADGIARGQVPFDSPMLMVRYAWPRRNGEPVGGVALDWNSIPRPEMPRQPMLELGPQIDKYFPPGSPAQGNWMLVRLTGEVLRTGHVDLGKNESLTSAFIERQMPGVRIVSTLQTSQMRGAPRPGDAFGNAVSVTVFVAASDTPLPPP